MGKRYNRSRASCVLDKEYLYWRELRVWKVKVKVKQSRSRPGVARRVPGS